MTRSFIITTILIVVGSGILRAENWGHWRGPHGTGHTEGNPPTNFGEGKSVKWKAPVPGLGSGSPIVWGDKVFVLTSVPQSDNKRSFSFEIHCFHRQTGDLIWKQVATKAVPHQDTHSTNTHASASPCTDGEHVYAHFGSRGTYCFTMDGKLEWQRDLGDMNTRNSFGEGSSPTLYKDRLIVPWDHEGRSAIFALNKATGEIIWETTRDEPTCWATPLIVEYKGQAQVIMNGQRAARAYDAGTGKELWRCGGQTERPCASAVALGDTVFVGSGFRGAFLGAFSLAGTGDIKGTKNVLWTVDHDTPDVASPLLSGNRLYFYKGKSGQLTCLDARTGKPHYVAQRVPGISNTYASPVAAGGKVYLTDRNGTITVVEDADKLNVLATNKIGEGVDATPAIVGNQIFIRSTGHLYCMAAE